MSVTSFNLTDMSPEERARFLKQQGQLPVVYRFGKDGVISSEDCKEPVRSEPLPTPFPRPCVHPGDTPFETVRADSDLAMETVLRELGRMPESDAEYLRELRKVGNEKGWKIVTEGIPMEQGAEG
jgi:ribosomal protein L15